MWEIPDNALRSILPLSQKFGQVAAAVSAQELWIRNANYSMLQSRTRVAPLRTSAVDVATSLPANFSHRVHLTTIRRDIIARGKLIVRYNSHNSRHLKCQPELIVAMRSCDEAGAECNARVGESYPNKFIHLSLSPLEGLIHLTKVGCKPASLSHEA